MKEKIEKIFEKYGLSKEHSLTPILSKLFEEEDEGKALRQHAYCVRKFLSDLTELEHNIGMLRQWLNEDRICDINRMVTNEQIGSWLKLREIKAKYEEVQNEQG